MSNLQVGPLGQFTSFLNTYDFSALNLNQFDQLQDIGAIDLANATVTQTPSAWIIHAAPYQITVQGSNLDGSTKGAPQLLTGLGLSKDGTELISATISTGQLAITAGTLTVTALGSITPDLGQLLGGTADVTLDTLTLASGGTTLVTTTVSDTNLTASFDGYTFDLQGSFNTNALETLLNASGSISGLTLTDPSGQPLLTLGGFTAPITLTDLRDNPTAAVDAAFGSSLAVTYVNGGSAADLSGFLSALESSLPNDLTGLMNQLLPFQSILDGIETAADLPDTPDLGAEGFTALGYLMMGSAPQAGSAITLVQGSGGTVRDAAAQVFVDEAFLSQFQGLVSLDDKIDVVTVNHMGLTPGSSAHAEANDFFEWHLTVGGTPPADVFTAAVTYLLDDTARDSRFDGAASILRGQSSPTAAWDGADDAADSGRDLVGVSDGLAVDDGGALM